MRIRWARFLLVLLFVTILNAGEILDSVSVGSLHIKPDLLLIMLVFTAARAFGVDAITASFLIGFSADISGHAMGPHMIAYGLFGSFLSQLQKVVSMKKLTHQVAAIFVVALVTGVLTQLLLYIKTGSSASSFVKMILGTAVYSSLAGPVIWFVLSAMMLSTEERQGSYRRSANW
jgi:rod shape-determining protein MreD